MLKLQDISKSYTVGDFTQKALDDVSIEFRDSEFVAILGPSGSGKTTLLNIVGGLDHYDSGDLVIEGISTRNYKDRDWDTYRNNRVGFVFQSYNLIPHQTVLANVELALTLSGVSGEERKARAVAALEEVGLADHVNKRPAQLSGGQMQRVAIARALVNNPEIVLADEPTGALDTATSVQIMDLLTEIAKDRLVIMVTHNPELADTYATRIVRLTDGVIRQDSNPFDPSALQAEEEIAAEPAKKIRRTRMGFFTALGLSFNNLMTKKGRTFMTAFAGSIGIIGIAGILALANGVNNYIASVEEKTLSGYPLQVASQGFDMSAMMVGMGVEVEGADSAAKSAQASDAGSNGEAGAAGEAGAGDAGALSDADTQISEMSIVGKMFESVNTNDLKSFKSYLEQNKTEIDRYAKSIQYKYNVVPQVFLADTSKEAIQVNPDESLNAMGYGSSVYSNSTWSSMASTDMFNPFPGTIDMAKENYDLKAGAWPEKPTDCMLVLSPNGSVSDFLLYVLNLRDREKLQDMVKAFMNEEDVPLDNSESKDFTYQDFFNLKLKLVNSANFYQHDAEYDVWVDKRDDEDFMKSLVKEGADLRISGIIQPKPGQDVVHYSPGIYYSSQLTNEIIQEAGKTEIVKAQLADPKRDVFNGKLFSEEDNRGHGDSAGKDGSGKGEAFDMGSLFSIDESVLANAIKVDASKLTIDPSTLAAPVDPATLPAMPAMTGAVNPTAFAEGSAKLTMGYLAYCQASGALPADPATYAAYMQTPPAQEILAQSMAATVNGAAMEEAMKTYVQQLTTALQTQTQAAVGKAVAQLTQNMSSAMSIDPNVFKSAFKFSMTEEDLTKLMMAMMSSEKATFDSNLAKLDYAQLDKPYKINLYAKDFEAKQSLVDILNRYNEEMKAKGEEGKVISYTDIVGTLMKSVTTIIDMISYVLIAFVSISLVVSSIMIGVITYISVLERRKEIGILRAIGASKGDVSRVFNAETIIEGLVAGLLGVGITAAVCVPVSILVKELFDVPNIAVLPLNAALVLVAISVLLTFVAGLIPARSAARKDPVEALRSE